MIRVAEGELPQRPGRRPDVTLHRQNSDPEKITLSSQAALGAIRHVGNRARTVGINSATARLSARE